MTRLSQNRRRGLRVKMAAVGGNWTSEIRAGVGQHNQVSI